MECECPLAGFCQRRGVNVNTHQHKLCRSGKVRQLDEMFQRMAGVLPPRKAKPPKHRKVSREPVGTALAGKIEGLIGVQAGSGCNCKDLAEKMDSWGVAGCVKRRDQILDALVGNRDILTNALRDKLGLAVGFLSSLVPNAVLREGADWLLTSAIEEVRNTPPVRKQRRSTGESGMKRFLSGLKKEQDRLHAQTLAHPKPVPDPFAGEPVLHFGAHLWPVKGHWQWHVNLWNQMPQLINGQCFVGIAVDQHTDDFETVEAALHSSFVVRKFDNTREGENPTFRWLQGVVPSGQDDVLIYCHGKGVRAHTATSEAVRRWSEAMYETVVFNHDMIRQRLAEGYVNAHSFRTFGNRPLSPRYKWHPSGTFFAVRAKYLPGKAVANKYGGVEAWLGDHFPAHQSWCEFYDNSMFTTLYDHDASREIVEPMLIEWRRNHVFNVG